MSDYHAPYEVRQAIPGAFGDGTVVNAPLLKMGVPPMADKWGYFSFDWAEVPSVSAV